MRHLTLCICIVAVLVTPALSHAQKPDLPSINILKVGEKAPRLSVDRWLKGDSVTAFAPGHVYLVEFWGTWCAPCIKSIPHLTKLQRNHADDPFTVLGIASHEFDGIEAVNRFLAEKGDTMDYVIGYDGDLSMEHTWQTGGKEDVLFRMPEAFVIDAEGTIAWKGHPAHEDELDEAIQTSLDNVAIAKKKSE